MVCVVFSLHPCVVEGGKFTLLLASWCFHSLPYTGEFIAHPACFLLSIPVGVSWL